MMPIDDGYSLLYYLRLNDNLSSMPFIFLTAKGMTSDRIRGYDLGCNVYLTKPFHPSELLSIVNNLLNSMPSNLQYIDFYYDRSQKINKLKFTFRELSILNLLITGMMNKEIASILGLKIRNVEKYVSRLLNKTKTRNRTELAQFSVSNLSNVLRANDGTRTRE